MPKPANGNLGVGIFLIIFSLPFVLGGLLAVWMSLVWTPGHGERWVGFVVGPVFIAVGCGLMAFAISLLRAPTPDASRPWTTRLDWSRGRINGSNRLAGCIVLWVFTGIWLALSTAAVWGLFLNHEKAATAPILFKGIFGIGFPLVGLGMVVVSITQGLRALRFGRSYLTLDAVPVNPGGSLSGIIDCRVSPQLESLFELSLSCKDTWWVGSGKDREMRVEELWSDGYECDGRRSVDEPDSSRIAVRFDLPATAAACGPSARGMVSWTLDVKSSLPGIDYQDAFDIPVFPGSSTLAPNAQVRADVAQITRRPVHERVRLEEAPGGLTVVFPAAMNPGLAMLGTGFLVPSTWMAWAYLGSKQYAPAAGCLLVVVLMLYATTRAWLMSTTVTVAPGSISLEKSLLGVRWTRAIDGVREITVANSGQSNGHQLYTVRLLLEHGGMGIGSMLRSRSEADHICSLMTQYLTGSPAT